MKENNTLDIVNLPLYSAVDVMEPELYEDLFPYTEIPKVSFNHITYPTALPEKIWVTDTTFRDGQQSMASFTVEQIAQLFTFMHELDNGEGFIRQSEFFLYSEKDRAAVKACQELGYEFPEITSWIRAVESDFELVKQMNIAETGMLMSCSDYHIFHKLKMSRSEAMHQYLKIAEKAMDEGIRPRCHLEDITRADFYGFVVPLVKNLKELSKQSGIPVKIRACDTLGLGVPYVGSALPRSVPELIYNLHDLCGLESKDIEWHGHNDYHNVVSNSTTAWLYGAASINGTFFGIGERTGNCPLEAMLFEYAQLMGDPGKINFHILTEMVAFFREEFGYEVHEKRPFVGAEFNVTKAGIHADGILKNEAIYNSFDTDKILNRPIVIKVNQSSGLAGIAAWLNGYYSIPKDTAISKRDPRVISMKHAIDQEYAQGRNSDMSNGELTKLVTQFFPNGITGEEESNVISLENLE